MRESPEWGGSGTVVKGKVRGGRLLTTLEAVLGDWSYTLGAMKRLKVFKVGNYLTHLTRLYYSVVHSKPRGGTQKY